MWPESRVFATPANPVLPSPENLHFAVKPRGTGFFVSSYFRPDWRDLKSGKSEHAEAGVRIH